MGYGLPFTPTNELQRLVEILNGDDETGDAEAKSEITNALTVNVTTVEGQKTLLNTARKYGWLDESQKKVKLAKKDGAVGFGHFHKSFTAALSFYVTAVEGNHRLLAILAALLRCKVETGSVFTPSEHGDETFLTKTFIGIEENEDCIDDAMEDAFAKLNSSDKDERSRAILSHLLDAQITVASKTATKSFTAIVLSENVLHRISREMSLKKTNSTVANKYRGMSCHDSVVRDRAEDTTNAIGQDSVLVYQGEEVKMEGVRARKKRTVEQFRIDPSITLPPIVTYHTNPLETYEQCQDQVQLKVGGGGPNETAKLPVNLTLSNFGYFGKNKANTIELNMNLLFPFMLATQGALGNGGKRVLSVKQIGAMLAGGVCAPRPAIPHIDRPKNDHDGHYDDTPTLFSATSEGIMVTSSLALVYLIESAKLCDSTDLLDKTFDAFSIMSSTEEKAHELNLRIGKS